jgi:hypothetical protein
VAKAREIGVRENVAILDDGGNLKAFQLGPRGRALGLLRCGEASD